MNNVIQFPEVAYVEWWRETQRELIWSVEDISLRMRGKSSVQALSYHDLTELDKFAEGMEDDFEQTIFLEGLNVMWMKWNYTNKEVTEW